jgi:ABC-type glycerol-3-phosphate transport system substrate-binding protein
MLQLLHHIPDAVDADADLFIDQGEEAPLLSYYVLYGIRDYQLASVRAHEPVTFIGFPTLEGKNGHGISSWRGVYSILEQSRHKEGAWEFMEYIFAMDMMDYGGITDHLVIPVKKSELEKFIAEVTAPDYQLDKNGDPLIGSDGEILRIRKGAINYPGEDPAEYYAATPEEIEGLRTLIDSAGRVVSNNDTVMKIVQEEAKGYFDDQKTLDEVANIIQNRVQIYMSENR